eukprot:scaffold34645_cov201-Amphora_coffeaeformis.AAC.9
MPSTIIAVPFRLTAWILLVLSSAISIVSLIDGRPSNNVDEWEFELFWSVILVSIAGGVAMIMSIIHGVAALRHSDGTGVHDYTELAAVLVAVVAWVMVIPVVMNPDKELAIDAATLNIIDANLYFSCWWGFMASLALFVYHGGEALMSHNLSREWICLVIASLVSTMAASNRIDTNCSSSSTSNEQTDGWCKDLRVAISLATFSAACAATVAIGLFLGPQVAKYFKQWVFLAVAAVALGLWVVLVALLTFKDGAAKQVGTLFFGIWISALLSFYICLQHLHAVIHGGEHADEEVRTDDDDAHDEKPVSPGFPDIEMGEGEKPSTKQASPDKQWWKDDGKEQVAKNKTEAGPKPKKKNDEKEVKTKEQYTRPQEEEKVIDQETPLKEGNRPTKQADTRPKDNEASKSASSEKRKASKDESSKIEEQKLEEEKSDNTTKNAKEEEEKEGEEKQVDMTDITGEEKTGNTKENLRSEEKERAGATSSNDGKQQDSRETGSSEEVR